MPSIGTKINAVMLVNSADEAAINMTSDALLSLRLSGGCYPNFRCMIVETQPQDKAFYYAQELDWGRLYRCFPGGDFNYNRFLNYGLTTISSCVQPRAEYTLILNNDLLFDLRWLDEILLHMETYNLDSASPLCPGWELHKPWENLSHTSPLAVPGHDLGKHFCGWCLIFKTEVLNSVLPLDERFAFEWQDVDMIEQLKRKKPDWQHALIPSSKVNHLLNGSHRLLTKRDGMIEGAREIFEAKYSQ